MFTSLKTKLAPIGLVLVSFLMPAMVMAQTGGTRINREVDPISSGDFRTIGEWIQIIIPIVAALALLFFFWQLAMYIFKTGDEKADAKKGMVTGIIVLFVIASVWGIVALIGRTVGVGQGGQLDPPGVDITPDASRR